MGPSVVTTGARRAAARCGGHVDGGDLCDIDITQAGPQYDAPKKASSGTGPDAIGVCAATKLAITAARSRSVPPPRGDTPKSDSAHRVQRPNDAQRVADDAPTIFCVLVRERTCAAVAPSCDHSDRAHAIAASEYRYTRPTPRGTTTKTAPHALHRYRRATTSVSTGCSPGASGPSTVRARRPCPTITSARPGSRLTAAHAAQHDGRAASHEGGPNDQDLTSIAQ